MNRIWFERPLPPKFLNLLAGVAIAVGPASATPEQPLSELLSAHAAVVGSRIQFNGSLLDRCPELRVIVRTGIGVDNISIPDATARTIAVCNVPDGPTISTAEHTLALILATVKHLKQCDRELRRGGRMDFFSDYDGLELNGRCLGLVGMGRIGSQVAKMAQALGMQIAVFDPYLSAEQAAEAGVELAPSLEAMLQMADVVSVHAPFTPATYHLINAERIAQMKPGSYLINTARGGLVDEAALLEALKRGHVRGAGLDVFDPEPPHADNPLLHRDDVVATGHVAGGTQASKDRLWEGAIVQALQVLQGQRPEHLVNQEVWPLMMARRSPGAPLRT